MSITRYLTIIGKLLNESGFDYRTSPALDGNEREICELALREAEFYGITPKFANSARGREGETLHSVEAGAKREPKRKA